jgi:hypothetical protein
MDITACNYDASATCDDGSCILPDGCTDANADNYDASATCDDDSCEYSTGCTNPNACNYNPDATIDDGSCIMPDGCMDPNAYNYDSAATCDNGDCIDILLGCMDATAFNYNSSANIDDGSCVFLGCTNPTATNYNSQATTDDGTCVDVNGTLITDGCMDANNENYWSSAPSDGNLDCDYTLQIRNDNLSQSVQKGAARLIHTSTGVVVAGTYDWTFSPTAGGPAVTYTTNTITGLYPGSVSLTFTNDAQAVYTFTGAIITFTQCGCQDPANANFDWTNNANCNNQCA